MTGQRLLVAGLMSGTSLDGIDGVLVAFDSTVPIQRPPVLAHASEAMPPALRQELLALNTAGEDELHRAALAANALARLGAAVVGHLLRASGKAARDVAAIGSHGQTVRHRPQAFDGTGYTLQIQNAALLAELCGIDVVSDFRSRDVAAGGQGAPLVPAFHHAWFAEAGTDVAVLNLGGIANLSVLGADGSTSGFDCGPANVLIDAWCQRHTGAPYDAGGAWAAGGTVLPALLQRLQSEPFLAQPPPRSTGRDLFHIRWLDTHVAAAAADASPRDVQATLLAFTADTCADAVRAWAPATRRLYVCGGGAFNEALMRRLTAALPDVDVSSSLTAGLAPQLVEATAFAWLAWRTLRREPGNLPAATGARGLRILGAIHPA